MTAPVSLSVSAQNPIEQSGLDEVLHGALGTAPADQTHLGSAAPRATADDVSLPWWVGPAVALLAILLVVAGVLSLR